MESTSIVKPYPEKEVGPFLPKRSSKFLVYKQYFPNQTSSNFVQPVTEYSSNFRRYGGISTDINQKVFSGKRSHNVAFGKMQDVLSNGLPVPEQMLDRMTQYASAIQKIAQEKIKAISLAPVLEYCIRFLTNPSNQITEFNEEFSKGVVSMYPPSYQNIIREVFFEGMRNLAARHGEMFDFSKNYFPSREKLIELLKSMYYTARLPIEARLNQNLRYRIERLALAAADELVYSQMRLQQLIKYKRDRDNLMKTMMTMFRYNLQKVENDTRGSIAFLVKSANETAKASMGTVFGVSDDMTYASATYNRQVADSIEYAKLAREAPVINQGIRFGMVANYLNPPNAMIQNVTMQRYSRGRRYYRPPPAPSTSPLAPTQAIVPSAVPAIIPTAPITSTQTATAAPMTPGQVAPAPVLTTPPVPRVMTPPGIPGRPPPPPPLTPKLLSSLGASQAVPPASPVAAQAGPPAPSPLTPGQQLLSPASSQNFVISSVRAYGGEKIEIPPGSAFNDVIDMIQTKDPAAKAFLLRSHANELLNVGRKLDMGDFVYYKSLPVDQLDKIVKTEMKRLETTYRQIYNVDDIHSFIRDTDPAIFAKFSRVLDNVYDMERDFALRQMQTPADAEGSADDALSDTQDDIEDIAFEAVNGASSSIPTTPAYATPSDRDSLGTLPSNTPTTPSADSVVTINRTPANGTGVMNVSFLTPSSASTRRTINTKYSFNNTPYAATGILEV